MALNKKLKHTHTNTMMIQEKDCGRKEKALYFSTFNNTSSYVFNKGPHIFILHKAPQIIWLGVGW